jgi:hypothetical protein
LQFKNRGLPKCAAQKIYCSDSKFYLFAVLSVFVSPLLARGLALSVAALAFSFARGVASFTNDPLPGLSAFSAGMTAAREEASLPVGDFPVDEL